MNLHVVIYSKLFKSSGGRETWLEYFIDRIDNENIFSEKFIYAVEGDNSNNKYLDCLKKFDKVFKTNISMRKGSSYLNILKFGYTQSKNLKKYIECQDIVLLVGSFNEIWPVILNYKYIKKKKCKIITWIRSIPSKELTERHMRILSKLILKCELFNLKHSNIIIANGYDTCDFYSSSIDNPIYVIPNAVEIKRFNECDWPKLNKKIRVGFYGRLNKSKGIGNLCNIIEDYNIRYNQEDVEFIIYGWGDDAEIFKLQKKYANVCYMGKYNVDNLINVLNQSDVVLLLNKFDSSGKGGAAGISHSMLEFMAAKKLIIAWNTPTHNQVLSNNEAVLIKENDVSAVSDTINNIINCNDNRYFNLVENLSDKIKKFDIKNHMELFYNIIGDKK